jgi:hypothetical protein
VPKRHRILILVVAMAALSMAGCGKFIARKVLERFPIGNLMALYPVMTVAHLVTEYRAVADRCPLSQQELEDALVYPEDQEEPPPDPFEGFTELTFYQGAELVCVIEFAQPKQKASEAFGGSEEADDVLKIPARSGVIRLQGSAVEGAVRTTPFTAELWEAEDDGATRKTALPPSTGTLVYDPEAEKPLQFNVKIPESD